MAMILLSYLRLPFMACSGLIALGSALLYFKQNELIYPRNIPTGSRTEDGVPRPDRFGVNDYDELRLQTPDGETLSAFLLRPSNPGRSIKATILMFHGNAGNIGHRVPIARVLVESIGCTVMMVEYRGYGLSTGTPNETGLRIDAQVGLDFIRRNPDTKNSSIVIYGQSLGGAVATYLVSKNQDTGDIAALILENTFLSIRKMIPSVFPPARFLTPFCHQYWATEDILPSIRKIPILFQSGLKDEIVPPAHMKELFSICRSSTKTWRQYSEGSHNNTVADPGYFVDITHFVLKQVREHSHQVLP